MVINGFGGGLIVLELVGGWQKCSSIPQFCTHGRLGHRTTKNKRQKLNIDPFIFTSDGLILDRDNLREMAAKCDALQHVKPKPQPNGRDTSWISCKVRC